MTPKGAFSTPSGSDDFARFLGGLKMPKLDIAAAIEAGNKNFAVLNTMSAATFESITAIAQCQGEMIRTTVEGFAAHGREMLSTGTLGEKSIKQIKFAKQSYEAAMAHAKYLAELYAKAQAEALAAVHLRVTSLSEEIKTASAPGD